MHSYFIAIPLPEKIQSRLASFCYGLPQVHWVEKENFHLTLRYFGLLSDLNLIEIKERLKSLFFSPFFLSLQGVGHFHSKRDRGTIWAGVVENENLNKLKKEINHQLLGLILAKNDRSQHVTLGHYDRLNPQKLGDYLSALDDYQSEPFEVTMCHLIRTQHTPKRIIYEIIENYLASPLYGKDED